MASRLYQFSNIVFLLLKCLFGTFILFINLGPVTATVKLLNDSFSFL